MTSPDPNAGGSGDSSSSSSNSSSGSKGGGKAPKVSVLDVVEFRHHDSILGVQLHHVGVVVRDAGDGGTIAIRPLENRHLEVDPADVTPITADDV